MRITVERLSEDKLSRHAWFFDFGPSGLRLTSYAEEQRNSPRHKWIGPFWSHMDERKYYSKLTRPTNIPADVLKEAHEKIISLIISMPVYIGWCNEESRLP